MSGHLHITDATVYFDGRRLDGVSNVSLDLVEEEFATEADDLDAASWSIHRSNVLGVWPAAVEAFDNSAGLVRPRPVVERPPPGDVLQRIDEAIAGLCECGCGTGLKAGGPSAYYVDATHQRRWQESQATDPQDVYSRPDAAAYPVCDSAQQRLREDDSVAIQYAGQTYIVEDNAGILSQPDGRWSIGWNTSPEHVASYVPGDFRLHERFARLEFDFSSAATRLVDAIRQLGCTFEALHLASQEPPSNPMERALWLRKHRNTGPRERARVPRRIDATRSR